MIIEENTRVIRSIVDVSLGKGPKAAPGDVTAQNNIKNMQDYFTSCMDEVAILRTGRKPVADEVQKILKSLPEDGSGLSKTDLSKTMGQMMKMKMTIFVDLHVIADSTNPLVNIFKLWEGRMYLPFYGFKGQETVQLYQDTIVAMFQIILGEEDVANRTEPLTPKDIKQEWLNAAKDVVDFEIQLAGISTNEDDQYDPTRYNNPRTVEQLSELTPSIDWPLLFQEVLPAGVQSTRPIVVVSPTSQTKLEIILQKTSTKTLQHYFFWTVIYNLACNLGRPYHQPLDAIYAALTGVSAEVKVDRWKPCVEAVNNNLGNITGHYFVQQRFGGNSRTSFMAIIESLRSTYAKSFSTLQWLDKTTRDDALEKLKVMVSLVGYSTDSPDVASSKSLEAYFKGYTIFAALDKPNNRTKFNYVPQTANVYYDPTFNQIGFPAGLLQTHVFNVNSPEYINFGGIGVTAGHEIGWWTNATEQTFNEKAQCFVEQYGNFTVKGLGGKDYNVNGQLTLSENIADNGGLKQAF
ncbi:hypothetical protein BGX23_012577, partial [Mortierella sp. AD031]